MLKDITIGQYYNTKSPIHDLDPRFKILSVILYMTALFVLDGFIIYIPVVLLMLGIVWLSKVPFKFILRGLKPIFFIILFAFVLNVFFTPGSGKPFISFAFVNIYAEGIKRAFFMAFRLIMLIIGTSLLTLTTSPIQLTDGIEYLLNPFKKIGVPAHEIAMMMTIALRFIPTLLEETDKIMKAQMARGADFESGNLLSRAKGLIPLLVPLFLSAFRRADDLGMAMEARCYRGGEGRTRLRELKYTRLDAVGLLVLLTITVWYMVYFWIIK